MYAKDARATMTHAAIISNLYANFAEYRALWSRQSAGPGGPGAFVFLPDRELEWEWWTVPQVRDYIRQGGLDDERILEGLAEYDLGEEILVLIIEYANGPESQRAHFHRLNQAHRN